MKAHHGLSHISALTQHTSCTPVNIKESLQKLFFVIASTYSCNIKPKQNPPTQTHKYFICPARNFY